MWHQATSRNNANVDHCPCCGNIPEDQEHLIRCSKNPAQALAIRDFHKTIFKDALHAIYYLFSFGLLQWLADGVVTPPDTWDLRGYPSYMHSTILDILHDQLRIGWFAGFKGFLSRHWISLASMSMSSSIDRNIAEGSNRLRTLIKASSTLALTLWKGRNDVLHRSTDDGIKQANRLEDDVIRDYYSKPELLSSFDQHYISSRPLAKLLTSSRSNRRRWLRQVQLSRARRLTSTGSQPTLFHFYSRTAVAPVPTLTPDFSPPPLPAPPPRQRSLLSFFSYKSQY